MRSAANTHRALKQDEAKEKREMNSELLEDVLASDNLAQAWKRVKANKGAPGIDGVTIGASPTMRAHTGQRYDSRSSRGDTSRRPCEG